MDVYQVFAVVILVLLHLEYAIAALSQSEKEQIPGRQYYKPRSKKARLLSDWKKVLLVLMLIVDCTAIFGAGNLFDLEILKRIGIALGCLGVLIFTLTIVSTEGDPGFLLAGYFQQKGIYRLGRNPVFLAFNLVYIGICVAFFSWVLCFFTVVMLVVNHLYLLENERLASLQLGMGYRRYVKSSWRYFGPPRKLAKKTAGSKR